MTIKVVYTCPLGSVCEEVKKGKDGESELHRCRWFVKLQGENPQNGEKIDEFRCTQEWGVLMAVENTKEIRHSEGTLSSFRNEVVKQNNELQVFFNKKLALTNKPKIGNL